jgi:NAD(P)-dependent dehydrogenase (short-subunit alcohol dehydrogenase family)
MVKAQVHAWLAGDVSAANLVSSALIERDIATTKCSHDDPSNADRWANFKDASDDVACPDAVVFFAPRSLRQYGVSDVSDYVAAVTYEFIAIAKLAVRSMAKAEKLGSIIAVCDISGVSGRQGQSDIAAAAGALIGATKCLAKELGRQSISVNAICHGFIPELGAADNLTKDERQLFDMMRLGKSGTIQHVVENVVHLIRNQHFMTGQVLHVDDGLIM